MCFLLMVAELVFLSLPQTPTGEQSDHLNCAFLEKFRVQKGSLGDAAFSDQGELNSPSRFDRVSGRWASPPALTETGGRRSVPAGNLAPRCSGIAARRNCIELSRRPEGEEFRGVNSGGEHGRGASSSGDF